MKPLASLRHDSSDQLRAMDLARAYGTELYTGVLYRNPKPPPTYEALVRIRQDELARSARPRAQVLERYVQP